MTTFHETATVTSKGQITLPKAVRQALGVEAGSKLFFDLIGSQLIVSRIGRQQHEDPAIAGFLVLLEKDVQSGRRVNAVPKRLTRSLLAALRRPRDHSKTIVGDVAL